ncbi:FtsX-like permease family protein [Phenylobacterium sp.]|uniref:FtsX-like permease family protein n=1 Tax=Phenylobacterium sp. TaxID=1871053 RepID=UPI003563573B
MFGNYLAAALRNLQRNGVYAALTVAGLAIGFASAILIGLYLRHELTYDRFIPGHERVYLLSQAIVPHDKPKMELDYTSGRLAEDLKLDFPQIQYVARISNSGFPPVIRRGNLSVSEQAFACADPDFFKVMPMPAVAGDPATALEASDAVVLTRSAARKFFGQDAPLGGQLLIDGRPVRVAAVIEDLPTNSHLAYELFTSSKAPDSILTNLYAAGYSSNSNLTYVRLKPGASAAAMDAGLASFIERRLLPAARAQNPDQKIDSYTMRLKPLTSIHLQPADGGDPKPGADVKVLAGIGIIGVLIVVVAAINFVTLMTARASRRATEVGVRKALGAQRKDLVIQFMGEAMIYVAIALVLAVALAELLLPAVSAALQRKIAFNYLSDPQLLAVMIGVTLTTALLAGLYPAFVLSSFRPSSVLKGGPIAASGGGGVRQALVVAQFAVLIALLLSALTIYRQTTFALKDATHTNKDGVVMLFASPCTNALRDAVRAVPGVTGAACSSPAAVALSFSNDMSFANGHKAMLNYAPIDFGFFQVYGIHSVAGRLPNESRPGDDGGRLGDTPPPIVLNETAVRELGFKSPQDAIGHLVTWHYNPHINMSNLVVVPPARASEVIGVVPDFTFASIRQKVIASFYFVGPKTDMFSSVALNIKLDPAHPAETLKRVDKVWERISHGQPLQQYFADQFLLRLYIDNVIQGGFIAVCALIAVSIACLGLFALSAYTAERRTKEIGIRKAMGAKSSDILRLLLWQFAQPVLWANLLALPLAWLAMDYWLKGFAYHVDLAPWTFAAAAGAGVVIAWSTVFFHALRVARARPVSALRYE